MLLAIYHCFFGVTESDCSDAVCAVSILTCLLLFALGETMHPCVHLLGPAHEIGLSPRQSTLFHPDSQGVWSSRWSAVSLLCPADHVVASQKRHTACGEPPQTVPLGDEDILNQKIGKMGESLRQLPICKYRFTFLSYFEKRAHMSVV